MPIITVQMLGGRSAAQKSALIAKLAEVTMAALDVPEDAIRVVLAEVPPENWGVGTRTMAELRAGADPAG